MILSSPRLLVTLLLLYFTHGFHSCAFISFLSQRAEKHSGELKGKRDELKRRLCDLCQGGCILDGGTKMDMDTKCRGIEGESRGGKVTIGCDLLEEILCKITY